MDDGTQTVVEAVIDPVVSADTQEAVIQPSPADVSGNEDKQTSESTSQAVIPDKSQEDIRKRLEGKLKQEQDNNKKIVAEREAYRSNILKTEDRAREYLKDSGYTDEQIEAEVSKFKTDNPDVWKAKESEKKDKTNVDANEIAKIVSDLPEVKFARELKSKADKEKQEESNRELNEFFKAYPQYNPESLDEDKKKEVGDFVVNKVGALANTLQTIKPGLKFSEAMIQAANIIGEKTDDKIKTAQEDGFVEGLLTAAHNNSSTIASPSGNRPSNGNGDFGLTDLEKQAADSFGYSYEDYAKYK